MLPLKMQAQSLMKRPSIKKEEARFSDFTKFDLYRLIYFFREPSMEPKSSSQISSNQSVSFNVNLLLRYLENLGLFWHKSRNKVRQKVKFFYVQVFRLQCERGGTSLCKKVFQRFFFEEIFCTFYKMFWPKILHVSVNLQTWNCYFLTTNC